MSGNPYKRQGSGRDDLKRHQSSRAFDAAQTGGNSFVFAAFAAALIWIGLMAAGLYAYAGAAALTRPPLILAGVGALAFLPALLMIVTGFLARANARAMAAQKVLLDAAARLLAPAREAGTEGLALAEQVKQASEEIDAAMVQAVAAMKAVAGNIGDERHRLESVTYATTDNARQLTERLATERQALESLARDLRTQIQSMNEAIPRQAQMMIASARKAGEEVAAADASLDHRLAAVNSTSDALAQRLTALDQLASDAAGRTDQITLAVSRMEEKLDQARRALDTALKSGEHAANAAAATGDALSGAVTQALDQARAAHHQIDAATRAAADEAARSLARLREAGEQAALAVRNAHRTAIEENEALARRLAEPPRPIPLRERAALPETARPEAPPPPPATIVYGDRAQAAAAAPSPLSMRAAAPAPKLQAETEEDLFDAIAGRPMPKRKPSAPLVLGDVPDPHDREPLILRPRQEEPAPPEPPPAQPDSELGWRDIIAELGREEAAQVPDEEREAVSSRIISALRVAKIDLNETFKPRAKSAIAEAARRGDAQRRAAVLEHSGKSVEVAIKALRANAPLKNAARQFLLLERDDALEALQQTSTTHRNASPRLAAFLLIDAAI
jgi:hypothetical protein